MSGYIKYFENGGKNMSFLIKDNDVSGNYNEIWEKIKETLNVKFHSMPAYDEKYIKAKIREFNGVIKTNFLAMKFQKKMCITLAYHFHSVMKMEKKKYPQVYLEE